MPTRLSLCVSVLWHSGSLKTRPSGSRARPRTCRSARLRRASGCVGVGPGLGTTESCAPACSWTRPRGHDNVINKALAGWNITLSLVRILDFSHSGALSLTPCFSGVLRANRGTVNRFNGFVASPWFHRASGRKPLKRFTPPRRSPNTPLKQGVNERRAAAGKI